MDFFHGASTWSYQYFVSSLHYVTFTHGLGIYSFLLEGIGRIFVC